MTEIKFISRNAVRGSVVVAATLSAVLGVAGFLAYRNREIPVDPLIADDFNGNGRNEIVYREALEEASYALFIVNDQYVVGPVNGKYFRTNRGRELARGLPGNVSVEALDENKDGNLDLEIRVGNQYDVLEGDGKLGFTLGPAKTIVKRR